MRNQGERAADRAIGRLIVAAREASGLTQAALGVHLGLPAHRVVAFEQGRAAIPASTLLAVGAALKTPVAWFLDLDEARALPGETYDLRQMVRRGRQILSIRSARQRSSFLKLLDEIAAPGRDRDGAAADGEDAPLSDPERAFP